MKRYASDVAFTGTVKAEQVKRGSRTNYQRMEESGSWATAISPELGDIVSGVKSFYLATANAEGQPYIQHRGGPAGFLCVLDEKTLAFADYSGNRQYVTIGNLSENPRAYIFIMDYARRLRIKIWGRARVVEDDDDLLARVSKVAASGSERTIVFEIVAWDRNCKQHIPLLLPLGDVEAAVGALQKRIAELEDEVHKLRAGSVG